MQSLGREEAATYRGQSSVETLDPPHFVLSPHAFRMRFGEGDIWNSDYLMQDTEDCGLGASGCHHFQPGQGPPGCSRDSDFSI